MPEVESIISLLLSYSYLQLNPCQTLPQITDADSKIYLLPHRLFPELPLPARPDLSFSSPRPDKAYSRPCTSHAMNCGNSSPVGRWPTSWRRWRLSGGRWSESRKNHKSQPDQWRNVTPGYRPHSQSRETVLLVVWCRVAGSLRRNRFRILLNWQKTQQQAKVIVNIWNIKKKTISA